MSTISSFWSFCRGGEEVSLIRLKGNGAVQAEIITLGAIIKVCGYRIVRMIEKMWFWVRTA